LNQAGDKERAENNSTIDLRRLKEILVRPFLQVLKIETADRLSTKANAILKSNVVDRGPVDVYDFEKVGWNPLHLGKG
jgi:hypothetical protein